MQIFVSTPSGKILQLDVNLSEGTLRFIKQSLNQKGIDTSDVYFEISTNQGIRKYQKEYDNHVLEQLGVTKEMTIIMRSNNEQKNQQVNPQPNMQPLDKPQLNMINQQNAQSTNWNNPPPSFQQAQQNQQQFQCNQGNQGNTSTQVNQLFNNTPPPQFNPLQQNNNPPMTQFQAQTNNTQHFNTLPNQYCPQQPNPKLQFNQQTPTQQGFTSQYNQQGQFLAQDQFTQRCVSVQGQFTPEGLKNNCQTIQPHYQGELVNQSIQPNINQQPNGNKGRYQAYQSTQEEENQQLLNKLREEKSKLNEVNLKQSYQQQQIEKQNETINELMETNRKQKLELDTLKRKSKTERNKLMDQIEQLEDEKQYKDIQLNLQQNSMNLGNHQVNTAREFELEAQIQVITQQKNQLSLDIRRLQFSSQTTEEQQQANQALEAKILQLERSAEAAHTQFLQELDNSARLRGRIQNLEKDINIKEQSMSNQEQLSKQKSKKIQELEKQLQYLNEDLVLANQNLETFKAKVRQMIEFNNTNIANPAPNNQLINIFQQIELSHKAQQEQRLKREQDRAMEEIQQREQIQQAQKEIEREADAIFKRTKAERKEIQENLRRKFNESFGKIDVCFIVDITGSMGPYKTQTMNCIQESMKSIKSATNRDAQWACVAYQDITDQKNGLYCQFDFTPQHELVENFLKNQGCRGGGGDTAEDTRGGIKQACKLSWSNRFKIAILIGDAPTHGRIYNAGVADNYPDHDIRDAIEQLISQDIMLIGINLTNKTEIMFKEIFKIYEQHKKQELFLQSNMIGMAHSNVGAELVKLIQQASEQSTKTNERGSFSNKKNDQNKRPPTKDGAMEALCKQPNLFNFDKEPNVQVITTRFTVHQVDMKERAFTTNIQTIRNIRVPDDYVVTNEGKWDCIRTTKPFAFGMMKEVYLMKKQNDRESHLYVIKMPLGGKLYPSINEAIKECRSHLISKSLMRKFNRDLQDAIEKKRIEKRYPQIQYSDFLILEEGPNQFWIAERFFKGEFVKYNNNYGFIDNQGTEVNKLAQAFSYYTYWISNFNYIINDVQGVGLYFTDPAINTAEGDYDETDMGVDGQGMYMVTFQLKKHICKEILDILDIEI